MTLLLDGVASSSSIIYMSSIPMSRALYVRIIIKVIFLCAGRVSFPGSIFNIRSYASTILSSHATSLLSPHCTFPCGLWALRSSRRTTLATMMLSQAASASALSLLVIPALFHASSARKWLSYTFTILVFLFFFPPLSSSPQIFIL